MSKKRRPELPRDKTKRRDPIKVDTKTIGRLAMRHEGNFWNAYYAVPDSMIDAIYLGSLHMHFASQENHYNAFMALMQECVGDLLEQQFGQRPIYTLQEAPEHERSGNT